MLVGVRNSKSHIAHIIASTEMHVLRRSPYNNKEFSICTTDGFCDGKTSNVVRSFACCRIGMTDGWQSWRMRTRLKVSIQPRPRFVRRANRKLHTVRPTLRMFTQLKRNKRFDNFIMLVWVQGSPFHIAAGSHPVQEAWGSQDSLYRVKFKSCFNVVENHTNRFLLL